MFAVMTDDEERKQRAVLLRQLEHLCMKAWNLEAKSEEIFEPALRVWGPESQ